MKQYSVRNILTSILFALTLAACGGGGGGGSSDDNDAEDNSQNLQDESSLQVTLEDDANDIVSIIIGSTEAVLSNGEVELATPDVPSVAAAIDDDDNIKRLGVVDSSSDSIELTVDSTALTLLRLAPNIMLALDATPSIDEAGFLDLDSVIALSNYITDNDDWSNGSDQFIQLYADAIAEVTEYIVSLDSVSVASVYSSTTKQVAGTTLASVNIIKPQLTVIDEPDELSYNVIKSGVNVKVVSQSEETVALEIENKFKRWVIIITGDNPNEIDALLNIDGDNIFILGSASDVLTDREKLSISIAQENLEQGDFFKEKGVFAYGPGLGGQSPSSGQAETAYYLATTYTFMVEAAVPTMSFISGSPSACWKNLFRGKDSVGVRFGIDIAVSPSLRQAINAGNTSAVVGELISKLGDSAQDGAISVGSACIVGAGFKWLGRLIPLIGQALVLNDGIALAAQLGELSIDVGQSLKEEKWLLSQVMEGEVDIDAPRSADLPDLLEVINYFFPDTYFSGECPEKTICEGYYFDGEGPYDIAFSAECFDPVTTEVVACKNAILIPNYGTGDGENGLPIELIEPNPKGNIGYAYQYDELGNYAGELLVKDLVGDEKTFPFIIQLKNTPPQLILRSEGVELSYSIENEKLIIDEPIEITCCDEGEDSSTLTLELFNKGLGESAINVGLEQVTGDDNFEGSPASSLAIPAQDSATIDLTYTPTELLEPTATYKMKGNFGVEDNAFDFKPYSVIEFDVKGVTVSFNNPIFENLIGTWHIYEDLYTDAFYGSACHNENGTLTKDGVTLRRFTASNPLILVNLYEDGTMTWGVPNYIAEPSGDWWTCRLTGGFQSGEITSSWNYTNSSVHLAVSPLSAGGGIITEVKSEYEWIIGTFRYNEPNSITYYNIGHRWVKQ